LLSLFTKYGSGDSNIENSRKKSVQFWFCYFGISITLAFVALEAGVRLFHIAPVIDSQYSKFIADKKISYKPRPNSIVVGKSASGEFDFDYRHNSLGFRDEEHALEKPKGVYRILGLGDSFTYGAGATYEESWLYQLERKLNTRDGAHPKVEIIKGGIAASWPEPERKLLEIYGVQYRPDLVIVGFLPNDVIDTALSQKALTVTDDGYLVAGSAGLSKLNAWLYLHSHLWRLARYAHFRLGVSIHWPDIYKDRGYHENSWQQIEAEYLKMLEICHAIIARLVIIHIPQKPPWDESKSYTGLRLSEWAKKNDVVFIDTLPAFQKAPSHPPLYWAKDGHCTPAGYRVIADTVYETLTKDNIVK